MRQPKPYFRKQKKCWYVQIGSPPRQLSLGKDKKEAWRKYHELMAANEPLHESTATVEDLFERYLEWLEKNRKPGTYKKVQALLTSFAKFIGKSTKVAKLSGSDLSNWVEKQSTWNSTTRNDAIVAVVRCFNWAVGKRYLRSNNVAAVPDKPRRKRREVTLSDAEWKELLSHVKDQAFRDLLIFMWETGARPFEARTVEAKQIHLDAGLIIFEPSDAKGERHERVIYLTPTATEICKRRMEKHPTGYIFLNTRGDKWTKDSINCRFQRLKKKLGGKRVFAYAIRHSYATNGLMNGMDSLTLSQLMGHADTSMLAKTYSHLAKNPEFLKAQAKKLREVSEE